MVSGPNECARQYKQEYNPIELEFMAIRLAKMIIDSLQPIYNSEFHILGHLSGLSFKEESYKVERKSLSRFLKDNKTDYKDFKVDIKKSELKIGEIEIAVKPELIEEPDKIFYIPKPVFKINVNKEFDEKLYEDISNIIDYYKNKAGVFKDAKYVITDKLPKKRHGGIMEG